MQNTPLHPVTEWGRVRFGSADVSTEQRNFVLHFEQVGEGFIEPLGPEMCAGLRVDELDVDAQSIAGPLNATLQQRTFSSRPICFTSKGLPL